MKPRILWLGCVLLLVHPETAVQSAEVIEADVCAYGGTCAGVAAAVQATRMGRTTIIVEPGRHLGGLSSGGLGATDIGNKAAIGGISREFINGLRRITVSRPRGRWKPPMNIFPGGA